MADTTTKADQRTAPAVSVVTATYQRADTLTRTYRSLLDQTCLDFEWIVVDDGSDDGTEELVRGWIDGSPFPIDYVLQANSGKHVAENVAAARARGTLMATVDSDDWYLPQAVETFIEVWKSIPAEERESFLGGIALCAHPDGSVVGSPFPADVLDATYDELRKVHGVTGDKAGFGRVEVIRQYPHPVFEGERLGAEAIQYMRLGRRYRLRCVNKVVKVNDYLAGGLSDRQGELLQKSPRTAMLLQRELLIDEPSWRRRFKGHGRLTRYALHAKRPSDAVRVSTSWTLAVLSAPIGIAVYVRDRLRRARARG